jgi:bis(5'-nucleosyl)-tetraphosphatase (symmetrical)
MCLLERVKFDRGKDELWFVGDLINRGPQSLEVLLLARSLGDHAKIVLGNHDLHFLAVATGMQPPRGKDTLDAVLQSPERDALVDWLRQQPLFYTDATLGYSMVHAGIPPGWSLARTQKRAHEVEQMLSSSRYLDFLDTMYGDEPLRWSKELRGMDRLRMITNYLTRMRFCTADGTLDLIDKTHAESSRLGFLPWYRYPNPSLESHKLVFGHWAALDGKVEAKNIFALDTGCAWGGRLTLMRLDDSRFFRCKCR